MSNISRRVLATATATAALSMSTMLGTALAETPSGTPTLSYTYTAPGNPGETGFWLRGEGCIGTDGATGTITANLTTDDGTIDSVHTSVGDDGDWEVLFSTAAQPGGTAASATAICDLGDETVEFPVASATVPQPPTDLPAIAVEIPDYPDGPGLYLTFDRCYDGETGPVGDVWYDVQAPSGMQSGFVLDDPYASGLLGQQFGLEEGHWVANAKCRLDAPYVDYDTVSFDLVNNNGTWSITNLAKGDSAPAPKSAPTDDTDAAGNGATGTGADTAATGNSASGTNATGNSGISATNAGTGSTTANGPLADTGTNATPLLLIGGALLLGGTGLIAARRHRTAR